MGRPRELSRSVSSFAAMTPTLPPATHTNSYALGARDVLLVEPATPYVAEQRAWLDWARALASQGRRATAIVATHHHVDHIGGLDVLARELALHVWVHAETATRLSVQADRLLADGDAIVLEGPIPERWEVLHTPGHAPGHVCLWNADTRVVVVGDMVASKGTILIAPGDGDMRTYLEQLDRLARLDADLALPAHGEPIDEATSLFRHYIAHRLMREEKVCGAVASFSSRGKPEVGRRASATASLASSGTTIPVSSARGGTAEELLVLAYDDTPVHLWPIAILSLRAHLEKLVLDGRVAAHEERYSLAQ